MKTNNNQPVTPAVDLFAPADRFVSASRLYGRLHRWWLLLGRYWWLIVLVLGLVLGPVGFLAINSPPGYESKARMWLTGKLDIYEGRLYTEELINFLGTQAELLRSPAIQAGALARLRPEFSPTAPTTKPGAGKQFRILQEAKALVRTLFAAGSAAGTNAPPPFPFNVKVLEGAKSSTLELWATGAEPASTRAFLNCLMEEYLNFKREARLKTSERTAESLGGEVTQLKRQLEVEQEKLHAFQASNNIVFLQEQGNSAGSYLASLNKQLATLRTELRLLEMLKPAQWVETGHKALPSGESLPDEAAAKEILAGLVEPQLELFKANQQAQLLRDKRAELSRFLRPLHPKIVKLNEQIATQERLVQISRDEALKQLAHRRQAIVLQVQNLEASFKEWDAKAIESSRKMADYELIRQNLQRLQAAYDKTLTVIQTVDVSKKVEQENVGILEPASVATPTHRQFRTMAIALAGSLLLSFGLIYCIGLFQDDFASLAELANQLSEEVVGQIPASSIKEPNRRRPGIEVLEKQRFEFLEAFRSIRSSLLFMNNGEAKPKTIIITSSVPEEGKSTVALYLAATLARGNSRVLLVDGDMRRGTLHTFFGAAGNPGLAEVLDDEIPFAEAMVPSGLENLALLPAGEANRNPGELVLSSAWPGFLAEIKPQFDFVLVDTPPVLAADDAASLAPTVDGVLFVVRGLFTSARMAREALDALRQRQVRVLGLIFNRAVSSPCEQHYYRRYRGSYNWEPKETGCPTVLAGSSAANASGS